MLQPQSSPVHKQGQSRTSGAASSSKMIGRPGTILRLILQKMKALRLVDKNLTTLSLTLPTIGGVVRRGWDAAAGLIFSTSAENERWRLSP
jgi:hypothetical protein